MLNAHSQQVEDTLNNSNELFLTFRKEMEEMSKKTKRLEKENQTLTRKHDQTTRNIFEMAEERSTDKDEISRLRRQEAKMRNIIKSMQEQGRGLPAEPQDDEEGSESEYDDDEYDDEEYEGDEEELAAQEAELAAQQQAVSVAQASQGEKPVFGPVPPPELAAKTGLANGVGPKH